MAIQEETTDASGTTTGRTEISDAIIRPSSFPMSGTTSSSAGSSAGGRTTPTPSFHARGELADIARCYGNVENYRSGWKSIRAVFHNFASFDHGNGKKVDSPALPCHNLLWKIQLFPGESHRTSTGEEVSSLSVLLNSVSCATANVKAEFSMRIITEGGSDDFNILTQCSQTFGTDGFSFGRIGHTPSNPSWGMRGFVSRADVLDPRKGYLVDGNLIVDVDINVDFGTPPIWFPKNRIGHDMLLLLDGASDAAEDDILTLEVGKDGDDEEKEMFYAHQTILSVRCPKLAKLADDCGGGITIPIDYISPKVFGVILRFIYGSDEDFPRSITRDILEAAMDLEFVELMFAAEDYMVSSGTSGMITTENAAELFVYAHAKKLALLKEAASKHIWNHKAAVFATVGFELLQGFPAFLDDLAEAAAETHSIWPVQSPDRAWQENDLNHLGVSNLRFLLLQKGLSAEGPKQSLVDRLKTTEVGCPVIQQAMPVGHVGDHGTILSEWKHIRAVFHDFETIRALYEIASPVMECHGFKWRILVTCLREGIGVRLQCVSCSTGTVVKAAYEMKISSVVEPRSSAGMCVFSKDDNNQSCFFFLPRSDILDPSKNVLSDQGNFVVDVSIQALLNEPTVFSPNIQGLGRDLLKLLQSDGEGTSAADMVEFEVGKNDTATSQVKKIFRAHRFILSVRSTTLAALAEGFDRHAPIPIEDVHPDMFQMLLRFIYGDELPPKAIFNKKARDFILMSNRFGCTGLKLAAEAEMVSSGITTANCAELILFADASNLPLLKEAAIHYFTVHHKRIKDTEGYELLKESHSVMKEVIMACMRRATWPLGDFPIAVLDRSRRPRSMCVAELRVHLNSMGKSVDGSKEMLIESLEQPLSELQESVAMAFGPVQNDTEVNAGEGDNGNGEDEDDDL